MVDRNFDDIAEKFTRNIYGTTKGQIREAVVWQDLDALLTWLKPVRCAFWMRAAVTVFSPAVWLHWGIRWYCATCQKR